jgi:hypothetical protein
MTSSLSGFEAGAKGQMYFSVDKDWSPTDMGLRGEIRGEAGTVINQMAEGVQASIGISGVHAEAVHAGKEINLFNYDPTK